MASKRHRRFGLSLVSRSLANDSGFPLRRKSRFLKKLIGEVVATCLLRG